jgi:transglutaminase-like putative cysteine protease
MDFNAWFEAYLAGTWWTFDARHNQRRVGRVLVARGRDATDAAMTTNFGPATLTEFTVITDEANAVWRKGSLRRPFRFQSPSAE